MELVRLLLKKETFQISQYACGNEPAQKHHRELQAEIAADRRSTGNKGFSTIV